MVNFFNHLNVIYKFMAIFYHGSPRLFSQFDLTHSLEGDGKNKFGYGIYVTSSYKSAAHYAGVNTSATNYYVYTLNVPEKTEDNHIAFKQPVSKQIISLAECKLQQTIPTSAISDGKLFRKFLATSLGSESAASSFLLTIGVELICWPYSWRNLMLGDNMAVLNEKKIKILKIEEVLLDEKKRLIEGSEKLVIVY